MIRQIPLSQFITKQPELGQTTQSKGFTAPKGSIVQGKVLSTQSPQSAKILINGKTVQAQTSLPLTKGQTALFKVVQTSPMVHLKCLSSQTPQAKSAGTLLNQAPFAILGELFSRVKNEPSTPPALSKMMSLFQQMALRPEMTSISPQLVKMILARSGLFWENKLKSATSKPLTNQALDTLINNDLKGLASHILSTDSTIDNATYDRLSQFVDSLEQMQQLNTWSLEKNGKMLFMIPMILDQTYSFGELLIDVSNSKESKKNGNKDLLTVTLLLTMSNLGLIRVNAVLFQNALKISFGVNKEENEEIIKNSLKELHPLLERHGFQILSITTYIQDTSDKEQLSLLDELMVQDQDDHHFSMVI